MDNAKVNNLKIAIKVLEATQKVVNNPSLWQSYEEEIIKLRKELES